MKKKFLITGATGEIGESLSEFYSRKDIDLLLAGRNVKKLKILQNKICKNGANTSIAYLDYNKKSSYKNIEKNLKNLAGLVLILPKIPTSTTCLPSKNEWKVNFINVFINPLEFLKNILSLCCDFKKVKIVILSGITSKIHLSNYSMSGPIRAAWHAQVKSLASVYGKYGIYANTLSLGGVMTHSFITKIEQEAKKKKKSFATILNAKTANVSLNKYASLADVCYAVEGLLESFSDHMTGNNFICDGGFIKTY